MKDDTVIEHQNSSVPLWIPVIFANLIPLYGVLFLGWDVFSVFFLYWIENVVIGFYTALKMLGVGLSIFINGHVLIKVGAAISTTFFIGFFTIHYGMFTMGHFSFLTSFFYEGPLELPGFDVSSTYIFVKNVAHGGLFWGVIAICIAEGVKATRSVSQPSEIEERLSKGNIPAETLAFLKTKNPHFNPNDIGKVSRLSGIMTEPYGRIIVLHIALLLGGFLMEFLHQPVWALGLLIILKIMYDLETIDPIKKLKKRTVAP